MGSVLDIGICPKCGREHYNSDYYYRTGEEYCFCTFCGYTKNRYLKKIRKNNGKLHTVKQKFFYEIKDMYLAEAVYDGPNESYEIVKEITTDTSLNEIRASLERKTEKDILNVICKKKDGKIEGLYCYAGNIEKRGKWLVISALDFVDESYGGHGVINFERTPGIGTYTPMKEDWYGKVDLANKDIVFATAVVDGKIKVVKGLDNPRYMTFRKLKGSDDEQVRIMDQKSGFYVCQWIDDLSEDEEAEHCFGMFTDEGELVGYMTAGYADDIDAIKDYPGYSSDSILLSDVYVKERYRHKKVGSFMIDNYLFSDSSIRDEHIFLTYLYDELQGFYQKLGFTKIEGTDNIMILPKIEYKECSLSGTTDELPFV